MCDDLFIYEIIDSVISEEISEKISINYYSNIYINIDNELEIFKKIETLKEFLSAKQISYTINDNYCNTTTLSLKFPKIETEDNMTLMEYIKILEKQKEKNNY